MLQRAEVDRTPLVVAVGLGGLIAVFLSVQPALQAGLVLVGIGLSTLALFSRRAALYLVIPAMALSPDIPILGIPVRAEDILIVPLAAGWLAHLCVFKKRQRTSLDTLLAAYFLVGLVATLWGGFIGTAHLFTTNKDISSPFHLLKRLEFVLVFFIIADTLNTPRDVRHFTYTVVASMVALNIYSTHQFLVNGVMASGPLGTSGHEAGVASMIAVLLAANLIPAVRPPAKLLLGATALFSLAVLPLSQGRNFLVATVLPLLYTGLLQRQRWVLVLPLLLALGLYLYPSHIAERVLSIEHLWAPDLKYRLDTPEPLVVARSQSPLYFGRLTLGQSPVLGFGVASVPLGFIDSEYSVQLVYTGLVGLAVFLILGVRLVRLAKGITTTARDPLYAGMARGFQLVLVAYGLYSIFASSISPTHTGGFFFVLAALVVVLHRSLVRPCVETRRDPAPLGTQHEQALNQGAPR